MSDLSDDEKSLRWRMILGDDSGLGEPEQQEWQEMDDVLDFLYSQEYDENRNVRKETEGRQGGSEESELTVPKWINKVHELFPQETIERLEKDAIDRYNMTDIVTNPEVLKRAQPNITLLKAVLRTKHMMNREVLDIAKDMVRKVIQELMDKLARPVESAFLGQINKSKRSFIKVSKNFDAKRTINQNLKNYDPQTGKIYIQEPWFSSRTHAKTDKWQIIILVDESASMLDSVIYSAVTASIFFGLKTIKTNLCLFDTEVVDVSADCQDPVETIMKVQMGGGTDIAKAVQYAEQLIENPSRTIVILISDLYEGGNVNQLLRSVKKMVEAGVTFLGLAALDDKAIPDFDKGVAQALVNLGAHVGAMTPGELAEWVAEKVKR